MIRVGIFFGGQSREREVSFAGGRTVYDNLNKELFEPVPVFIDSNGRFMLLQWEYLYKGTIRDFFPPASKVPSSKPAFQVYIESLQNISGEAYQEMIEEVGKEVQPSEFSSLMDVAFLALHGPYGEDGNIQGILEWYGIPYTGSGIFSSAVGIDKSLQKELFHRMNIETLSSTLVKLEEWRSNSSEVLFSALKEKVGFPFVVKAPHQGSSVGVTVLTEDSTEAFENAMQRAFFIEKVEASEWKSQSEENKYRFITNLVDIRHGIGLPVTFSAFSSTKTVNHPKELWESLDHHFSASSEAIYLQAVDHEVEVLVEAFVAGKEFSCIVVQKEDGSPMALPPTEIIKSSHIFDYRAKYLPGISRKVTPIDLPTEQIGAIRNACESLFQKWHFNVYARIDGFITPSNKIFLNDPNTTSGMLPSSFFFHQAAEIGLNPSQFLTYIIRTSLTERMKSGKKSHQLQGLVTRLDETIKSSKKEASHKLKVAVIMGGYSSERHISVESGRNIYEKLASSGIYEPLPIFLTGHSERHELYVIPVNIMLKDNADDIKEKIADAFHKEKHPVLKSIIQEAKEITSRYAGDVVFEPEATTYEQLKNRVDAAFIALHGRPGEDGAVQAELSKVGIPFNGSGVESSQVTIDKYLTKQVLRKEGFQVAKDWVVKKEAWQAGEEKVYDEVEAVFGYPFIAKPADDGCSSAVKKIDNREEFDAFCQTLFRVPEEANPALLGILRISQKEEMPRKEWFMVEELIGPNGADHFLEITGGLLTKKEKGQRVYEVFEPSEALASKGILSLEEKFLAGEGQNITPARFSPDQEKQAFISQKVRADLEKAARILDVEGYARIDAFVRIFKDRVETIIIEVNSLPGMTPATCIFHQSAINGYKPYQFIDRILQYGIQRSQTT